MPELFDAGRWSRVKAVFLEALDVPEADRRRFVAQACGADGDLQREVESLLESDGAAGSFCEVPAAGLLDASLLEPERSRLGPGARIGEYEIIALAGVGGMGEVYRARDTRLGREVAIKTVGARFGDPRAAARLLVEARHASSLNHPNICTIHEVGDDGGVPFIVMEFVDGVPLQDLLRNRRPPLEEALRYVIQITSAVEHAHARGIVHRDLKAANVVIDADGRAIVLDFGLAKRLAGVDPTSQSADSMTLSQHGPAGTLSHMAPEVLLGRRADTRSDIWAIGVLLYQLATGELPFGGRTSFETSSAILGEPPRPMTRQIPLALRLVIDKCLTKEPDGRYQNASDLRSALEAIQSRHRWRLIAPLLLGRRRVLQTAAVAVTLVLALYGANRLRVGATGGGPSFGTLAVLPLENATGDPGAAFYAEGITEGLTAQLGTLADVRVISRTSAAHVARAGRRPSAIAHDLGADAVVEGVLRRSVGRVILELQLVDAPHDRVIWSNSYDRGARDVLAVEADAVRAIGTEIRAAIPPATRERLTVVPAISPDVYEAYLRGRYEWNQRTQGSLQRSIAEFKRAIELDPAYAPAHAALADCYNQLGTVMVGAGPPQEYRPLAATEAIKALQIDPESPEAHAALGYVRHYQWRWTEAEAEFRRAIELNPNSALPRIWYANMLMSRDRFDESLRQASAARDLDPFSLIVNTNIGWILSHSRRYPEAIDQLQRTVELDPDYPQARWRLANALSLAGRYDESFAQVDWLVRLTGRSPGSLALLAEVDARAGRSSEARTILQQLLAMGSRPYIAPLGIAGVYEALGVHEAALDWLDKAFAEGSNGIAYLRNDPAFAALHANPRFQSLLRRAGLN